MMRTEEDLRAALRTLADDAPQLKDVLPTVATPLPRSVPMPRSVQIPRSVPMPVTIPVPRESAGRRRWRLVSAVAAVVAVLAVSAGVAARHGSDSRDAATPSSAATPSTATPSTAIAPVAIPNAARVASVDIGLRPVPGYYVTERAATELFQRVTLATKGGAAPTVTVYRPGSYSGPTSGRPVRIGRVTGYVVADAHPTYVAYRATDPAQHQRAIVWQYAPRSWAMATGAPGTKAAAVDSANLLLARALLPAHTLLRIPFRLGYLPAGLAADSAYQDPAKQRVGPLAPYGGVSFRDPTPPASPAETLSWGAAFDIVAFGQPTLPVSPVACDITTARTFRIGTDRGCFIEHDGATVGLLVTLDGHAVRLLLNSSHYGTYADSQLVKILAALTLTPTYTEPGSWYPL